MDSFGSHYFATPLLEDALFAQAYDALSPRERACCKLLVARLHACLGEERLEDETRYMRLRQGFKLAFTRKSADWTLVLWDASRASPARILAALMPAILAGVPHILACQVDAAAAPPPPPVLVALELCGQETAAGLTATQALELLRDLGRRGAGRLVIPGGASWTGEALAVAREQGVLSWSAGAPRIGVCPSALSRPTEAEKPEEGKEGSATGLEAPDYGMLRFAHPDAEFVPLADAREAARYDCIVADLSRLKHWLSHAPLVLTPGHEWFWCWPDLVREFFMQRRYGIAD